jgi:hypothetical protein
VEEETGWRPRAVEFALSCQPLIGNADYPQDLYLARGAERVGEPGADEASEVRWVPLADTPALIRSGQILGAITVIGVQHALLLPGSHSRTSAVKSQSVPLEVRDSRPRNR